MPRINASDPSTQASASSSRQAEAGPSNVRQRSSARHQSPEGLQQRADQRQDPQPTRSRVALQTLRQTAQAVVAGGAEIGLAGVRLGVAAGNAFLNDPVRTTGLGLMAGGGSYALINSQLNNELETIRGAALVSGGVTLLAARAFVIQVAGLVQGLAEAAPLVGRRPQISQELAVAAINMVFVVGEPDPNDPDDLSVEVGRHAPQVIDHLADLRAGSASTEVARSARAANEDPAQLVRTLHALVTADPPVLSNRPNSRQSSNR